jgi:hypothetical protein
MRLVRVGRGHWDVLLAEQVVDLLSDLSSARNPKLAMLGFLRESVPLGGPQEGNSTVCIVFNPRSLKLAEFRKGERRGTKIRVIWFYGDEQTRRQVVCVRAFEKNGAQTPRGEIPAASALRMQFLEEKSRNELIIEDLRPPEVGHESRGKTRKGNRNRRGRS